MTRLPLSESCLNDAQRSIGGSTWGSRQSGSITLMGAELASESCGRRLESSLSVSESVL